MTVRRAGRRPRGRDDIFITKTQAFMDSIQGGE